MNKILPFHSPKTYLKNISLGSIPCFDHPEYGSCTQNYVFIQVTIMFWSFSATSIATFSNPSMLRLLFISIRVLLVASSALWSSLNFPPIVLFANLIQFPFFQHQKVSIGAVSSCSSVSIVYSCPEDPRVSCWRLKPSHKSSFFTSQFKILFLQPSLLFSQPSVSDLIFTAMDFILGVPSLRACVHQDNMSLPSYTFGICHE